MVNFPGYLYKSNTSDSGGNIHQRFCCSVFFSQTFLWKACVAYLLKGHRSTSYQVGDLKSGHRIQFPNKRDKARVISSAKTGFAPSRPALIPCLLACPTNNSHSHEEGAARSSGATTDPKPPLAKRHKSPIVHSWPAHRFSLTNS
jgi:hypothetical protein